MMLHPSACAVITSFAGMMVWTYPLGPFVSLFIYLQVYFTLCYHGSVMGEPTAFAGNFY